MTRTTPRRPPRKRPQPFRGPIGSTDAEQDDTSGAERLQKLLAAAGLGSRRKCEELITTGRVEVDRKVVTLLGAKANLQTNEIRVDGVALPRPKLLHYVVNKPSGVVCTNNDPAGRPRVIDLLPDRGQRLFTVGRLDMYSEGLILLTNDGELANRLAHPRYGVQKTYIVEVAGHLEPEDLAKLTKGVHLAEGFAKVVGARIKSAHKLSSTLEIVLDEGRNREIRRLLARVGHKVQRLKRIAFGPLRLGELPVGGVRPLTREERRQLREASSGRAASKPMRRAGRKERAIAAAAQSPKPAALTSSEAAPSRSVARHPKPLRQQQPKRPDAAGSLGAPRVRTVIGGAASPDLAPVKPQRQVAKNASTAVTKPAGNQVRRTRQGKSRLEKPVGGKTAARRESVGKAGVDRPVTGKAGRGRTVFGRSKPRRPG